MYNIEELKSTLESVVKQNSTIRNLILRISQDVKSSSITKKNMCDTGFLLREIITGIEETRKDISATKILVDKLLCIKIMNDTIANPTKPDIVQGEFGSASPHYKRTVTMPKKDTKELAELSKIFGITADGVKLGVAKLSWKKVCDYVTELTELGKPIPKCIPKIHDDYSITHRRKR